MQLLQGAGFAPSAGQSLQLFDYTLAPCGPFDALGRLLAWNTTGPTRSGWLAVQAEPVPEPDNWALMLLGSFSIAGWLRSRRSK